MRKQQKIIYVLSSLVIVLIISLGIVFFYFSKQTSNLENVFLANEFGQRISDMNYLLFFLEEMPRDGETAELLAQLNQLRNQNKRSFQFTDNYRNFSNDHYRKFLKDFDMYFYNLVDQLASNPSSMNDEITEDLSLIRGKLQNSILWGHGRNHWGYFQNFFIHQDDIQEVLQSLRTIEGKISSRN